MTKALLIQPPARISTLDVGDYLHVQAIVGGNFEACPASWTNGTPLEGCPVLWAESPSPEKAEPNFLATALFGHVIVGPVLIFGGVDAEGDEEPVTDEVINHVKQTKATAL